MRCAPTISADLSAAFANALAFLQQQTTWQGQHQTDAAELSRFSALPDEDCMARYQQGDAAAFRALYLRYRDKLHRYVLRLANHPGEAEEVFQEAWISVIRSKDGYRPEHSFAAWLFSMAHRRAADRWRALTRHAPDGQCAEDSGDPELLERHGHAVRQMPESHVHNDALRKALQSAVQQLPLPQREAFLLRAEAELSLEDIAAVTGVSRETVKSRLRYAQRRLREALESWR
jgi:RNA polymerase sigma factor (sigma-70 family)